MQKGKVLPLPGLRQSLPLAHLRPVQRMMRQLQSLPENERVSPEQKLVSSLKLVSGGNQTLELQGVPQA